MTRRHGLRYWLKKHHPVPSWRRYIYDTLVIYLVPGRVYRAWCRWFWAEGPIP